MIEVGRIIVKIAGRDAGLKGIIIDVLDNNFVLIDGQVRRRKCNILHIEPLNKTIKIAKNAGHEEVVKALKGEGIVVEEKKSKEKKERQKKESAKKALEIKEKVKKTSKKVKKE